MGHAECKNFSSQQYWTLPVKLCSKILGKLLATLASAAAPFALLQCKIYVQRSGVTFLDKNNIFVGIFFFRLLI
jgi:hypothetical protein